MTVNQVAAKLLTPFARWVASIPQEVCDQKTPLLIDIAAEAGGAIRVICERTEDMRLRAHVVTSAVDQIVGPFVFDGSLDAMVQAAATPCGSPGCDCHLTYGKTMAVLAQLKPLIDATVDQNLNQIGR